MKGVSAVINNDLANNTVHRIGRTGRAGLKGEFFTFITRSGEDIWKTMGIVEVMQKISQVVPPEIQEMVNQQMARQAANRERRMQENKKFTKVRDLSQLFSSIVQKVVEDTTKKLRIVEHLQAWLILGLLQRLYLGGGELLL